MKTLNTIITTIIIAITIAIITTVMEVSESTPLDIQAISSKIEETLLKDTRQVTPSGYINLLTERVTIRVTPYRYLSYSKGCENPLEWGVTLEGEYVTTPRVAVSAACEEVEEKSSVTVMLYRLEKAVGPESSIEFIY